MKALNEYRKVCKCPYFGKNGNPINSRRVQRQIENAQLRIVGLAIGQLTLDVAMQLPGTVLQRLVRTAQRVRHIVDLLQLLQVVSEELDFAFEFLQIFVFNLERAR